MKLYAFVDARHPDLNLVVITTTDAGLELEKVEVEVEDGENVVQAVKDKLGL
jgi:hypothetical protein